MPTAPVRKLTITAPIIKGGTGATSPVGAATALGIISGTLLGIPDGYAKVESDGKISSDALPDGVIKGVTLDGPLIIYAGSTNEYTISNYDFTLEYIAEASVGEVSIEEDILTYIAPSEEGELTLTVNGRVIVTEIIQVLPDTPTVTSPVNDSDNMISTFLITASAFNQEVVTSTHSSSDWQVATDSGFSTIVASSINDAVNKTSWTVTGLIANTDYYIRVRYKNAESTYSDYSATIHVKTKLVFLPSTEQAILTASDKATNDALGNSVSIDGTGTRIVVGASQADPSSISGAGAAYVFVRSGSSWTQEAKLVASTLVSGALFGASVSIDYDGDRIIVGANLDNANSVTASGAVYVFLRTGASWAQEAKLYSSDGAANDWFGFGLSTDVNATRIIVGSSRSNPGGTSLAGSAYIFLRTGTSWTQEAKLVTSDKATDDNAGLAVAMNSDGIRVVMSANSADIAATNEGAAYVFTRSSTSWAQEAKLSASDGISLDSFSCSLSISDDGSYIAVGARGSDPSAITGAGAVYIYTRSGTSWSQSVKLTASDKSSAGIAGEAFGHSVSFNGDGDRLAISARLKRPGALLNAGAAYIFYRNVTTWTEEVKLLASNRAAGDTYGTELSISKNGLYLGIGTPGSDPATVSGSGATFIYA